MTGNRQRQRSRTGLAKWFAAAGVIAGAAAAFFFLRSRGVEPRQIGHWLSSIGDRWWAPIAFIGLYALFNTLLVPATLLTLTAGVVWGWLEGSLWVLVASTIGSTVPYFIGRSGAGWVRELLQRRAPRIYDSLRREQFTGLLLMRLVPIVPYNVLNYAAGLAGVKIRDYVLATFVGTIPGILIFTYLAASIAAGLVSPREALVRVLIAGVLLALLVLGSRLLANQVRKRANI